MKIVIIGAAGMIGDLLRRDLLAGDSLQPIEKILLLDRVAPILSQPHDDRLEVRTLDITSGEAARQVAAFGADVVFHLAAVVSAEAEADFDKGYDINVRALWTLLEALREASSAPRLVFTSSLAVYGQPFPDVVPDDFHLSPQSSYGAQKAIGELLIQDYSRKGFVDGVSIRLPTIVVRPGKPNAAASGFLSSIIREPLAGKPAQLPVSPDQSVWIASPEIAVRTLIHAAGIPAERLGANRSVSGRGIRVRIADLIAALERVAGPEVVELIERRDDPVVERIVTSWPSAFSTHAARELGFPVDESVDTIVAQHLATVRH